jgi:hypothetical protein
MTNAPSNDGLWIRSLSGAVIVLMAAALLYAVAIAVANLPLIGV